MRDGKMKRLAAAMMALDTDKTQKVASLACAIEALDGLLVEKGVLRDNELLEKMERVILEKT
jgi:hypothetical protein